MSEIKIYTNESVNIEVSEGLKRRGINVFSARDSGNLGLSDTSQLEYAVLNQAVIFTHDNDFLRLNREWIQEGKEHWGIIYVHQDKFSVGEIIRHLMDYALILEAEEMKNRIEFL